MIIYLMTLAALSGIISSYYLVVIRLQQLMVVIYHTPFRFWVPYLSLYEKLETRHTYELLGGKERLKSHKDFLVRYQAMHPYATGHFKSLWDVYARQIGRDYGLVLLVALWLFWSVFWTFIGPFVTVQLLAFLHIRFVKNYRADFFASLTVSLMLAKASRTRSA